MPPPVASRFVDKGRVCRRLCYVAHSALRCTLALRLVSGVVHARALCNRARVPLQWAMLEALDVRLSLVACALRSRPLALVSARSLYSSALHSVFQFLSHFAYHTRFCQFWLSRLCVSSATPLRLVCCAFAPLLFSLLCLCSVTSLLCSSRLCTALLSLLCSVSASRSVPETSTNSFSMRNSHYCLIIKLFFSYVHSTFNTNTIPYCCNC